jgi:tetratricopeptide (TPR) repeat protein
MHNKVWPILVSAGSASIMVLAFFIPSIQDQWDRFESRRVVDNYVALGNTFFAEDRFDMAEKAFEKAFDISEQKRLDIEVKRLCAKINRVTMESLWGAKPPEDLEEIDFQYLLHIQKGESAKKERAITLNSYGIFLAALHRTSEARIAFVEAIQCDSVNSLFYVNIGNLYDDEGKTELALQNYKKAISLDPKNGRAHYNLGLLLFQQGKLNDAENALLIARENEPEDTDIARECATVSELVKKQNKK